MGTRFQISLSLVVLGMAIVSFGDERKESPPRIEKLKPLYPRTEIVVDGQSRAIIVVPDAAAFRKPAETLRDAIRQETGASLAIKPASSFITEDWSIDDKVITGRNLVALGNVNNNRLLSVLYGQKYVVADSIYPGQGGYVVRTVHDPFAKGINVLVLAGSDVEGVEKAISVFLDKFVRGAGRAVVLNEPVIDVAFERKAYPFFPDATDSLSSKRQPQYTGMDWFERALKERGFMDEKGAIVANQDKHATRVDLTGVIARIGQTYFRTGDRRLPPLMKDLLDKNRSLLQRPAKRHGMGGRSARHVKEWDLLEELPIWTDRDRLDISNALLMDASLGHEPRAFHEQVKEGCVQTMDENHGTCSALRSFEAWRYFHKYYKIPQSEYWMKCADAVFSAQASTFQILEDACGYLCYCPIHTMCYAIARPNLTYFKRGIARHHAWYVAVACMNNLGLPTGFGDASGIIYPGFFQLMARAAWFYRDPHLYWLVRNKLPPNCGLRIFENCIAMDLTVTPKEPTEWTGLIRVPLYEAPLVKGQGVKKPVFAPKKDIDPKLFNKIVFKENWDENGQYLLLDGAGAWGGPPGPHGHKHDDINTIINFTDESRMWLVDHTYQMRSLQDHSGVYFTCEGAGGYKKRTLARLDNFAENERYGLTRSTFVNWERSIFWKKGDYFLVIDRAIADKDGEFFARCTFKALGEAELRGKDLYLSQKGRFCKIVSDGQANVDVERSPFADENGWNTFYGYAEPVAKLFQQDKKATLKKGESITFVNLLYAYSSKEKGGHVKMTPVSDKCALIVQGDTSTLMGIGDMPGGLGKADMFVISDDSIFTVGCEAPPDSALASRALAAARAQVEKRKREIAGTASREEKGERLSVKTVKLDMPISTIRVADVDADGGDEWIVGGRSGVGLYESTGKKVWAFATEGDVRAIDVADLDGDGKPEIVFGCDDEKVRALDYQGKELWSFVCKESYQGTSSRPAVDYVKISDLDGDGEKEIVAGANWVHVLSGDGKLKWEKYMDFRRGRICGDFICGDVADINGDGKQEIIALFLTSYPLMQVLNPDGKMIVPADYKEDGHKGINVGVPVGVKALDLFGGGKTKEIIVCATKRGLRFFWHDQKRKEQGGGRVSGSFVKMCHFRPAPNDSANIIAANTICGVVGIKPLPKGKDRWIKTEKIWYTTLDEKITSLTAADLDSNGRGEVYVGTKAGNIYVLDVVSGVQKGLARIGGSPVVAFAELRNSSFLVAAKSDGTVVLIKKDER
ncbi:MAG: hypothetical protein GXP25_08865 [Planctomycetes bacterium]|nr:hypothetical protein [Planctomycetota bacterium]